MAQGRRENRHRPHPRTDPQGHGGLLAGVLFQTPARGCSEELQATGLRSDGPCQRLESTGQAGVRLPPGQMPREGCVCDRKGRPRPRPSRLAPESSVSHSNQEPALGALPHFSPGFPLTSWLTRGHRLTPAWLPREQRLAPPEECDGQARKGQGTPAQGRLYSLGVNSLETVPPSVLCRTNTLLPPATRG